MRERRASTRSAAPARMLSGHQHRVANERRLVTKPASTWRSSSLNAAEVEAPTNQRTNGEASCSCTHTASEWHALGLVLEGESWPPRHRAGCPMAAIQWRTAQPPADVIPAFPASILLGKPSGVVKAVPVQPRHGPRTPEIRGPFGQDSEARTCWPRAPVTPGACSIHAPSSMFFDNTCGKLVNS